ncbi:MAG: hypothetical protein WED04_09215 [Promethearchaeati archaeon SRVP18_Atabeyarchaeia-1]
MNIDEYINFAEKRIFSKGKAISSWYSSSRDQKVGDVKVDLLARGNMAVKGVLLSRMWSWTAPRWETLALVLSHRGGGRAPVEQLRNLVAAAESYMADNEIKWSWIVYVSESGFEEGVVSLLKAQAKRETGIMLLDLPSKRLLCNNSLVSRHGARVFRP